MKTEPQKSLDIRIENSPEMIKQFFYHLKIIENKSEKTVENYYYSIKYLLLYLIQDKYKIPTQNIKTTEEIKILKKNITKEFLESIKKEDILKYLYQIQSENGTSASTRKNRLSAYASLYKYLNTYQGIKNNPTYTIPSPKKEKILPKYLNLEQSQHLLDVIKNDKQDKYKRNLCIVVLLINCGLRVSELVNLNVNSISENTMRVKGKGSKERIIYLNQLCVNVLSEYLSKRLEYKNIKDTNALFISERSGKRIGVRRVQQIVKESFNKAGYGNEGFSTHKLRHTSATLMYQYGNVDIRVIQAFLGHENLGTTQIYTHISEKQLKTAVEKNPLASYDYEEENKN